VEGAADDSTSLKENKNNNNWNTTSMAGAKCVVQLKQQARVSYCDSINCSLSQNFGLYPVCIGRHSSVHARFVFLCAAYAYRKKERM
jgi:hypothetical protein